MARDRISDVLAFLAVARERSFSRAAIRRGVSPSSLSRTVRSLEESLGVRLLTRTTRSASGRVWLKCFPTTLIFASKAWRRADDLCKNHAFQMERHQIFPLYLRTIAVSVCLAASVVGLPARAERADRLKPLNVQADQTGTVNLQSQTLVFRGNVVITKGTMIIRASRVEVRQLPTGYDVAVAFGAAGAPATFRQKRDGVDEYIAGEADRLEYDGKADTIRFVNNAAVRRLRGATLADEVTGNLVTYDSTTEVFSVSGGAPATAANPSGRVRAVLTPRQGSEAAVEAAQAASAPRPSLQLSPALSNPAASGAAR